MRRRCDRFGEWLLMYEGAVIATRKLGFRHRRVHTISEVVWRFPIVGLFLVGYLADHFWRRHASA